MTAKKLKQGLTERYGDVDILGFENGPSLSQRKMNVQNDQRGIAAQIDMLKLENGSKEIRNLPSEINLVMKQTLIHFILYLSENARNVRKKEHRKNMQRPNSKIREDRLATK